jgi:putative sterol carrier protein
MARFLSEEWLAELDQAIADDEQISSAASGVDLTIQQVVTRRGAADVCYATRVADGRVRLRPGRVEDADAVIREDYETAAALARGETSPQDAILAGRIRVSGNLGALLEGQQVLERVRACLDEVRARTDY